MMTFKNFVKVMNWVNVEFNEEQLKNIYESVNTEDYDTLEQLENDDILNDATSFYDVNLTSLIENLIEGGYNAKQIVSLCYAHYETFADLYYLKDDNIYCMVYGTR